MFPFGGEAMPNAEPKGLVLSWYALLVAIPSFGIYLLNDQLLATMGSAPISLSIPAEFDIRREHGARLEFLASFLVFIGVASGVIAAFVLALLSLNKAARIRIAVGALLLTLIASTILWMFPTPGIPADIGLPSGCPAQENSACQVSGYPRLLAMLGYWKWGMVAAAAALVFGTICCLADASPRAWRAIRIDVLKRQASRLQLFLYLSAMLLVSALLVQLTFLRWPRFALPDSGPLDAHVGMIILYYGVGYSIFLASFYLPVAVWLGRRAEALADRDLRDEIFKAATQGPVSLLRTGATILAPALAGILSTWIDMSS